MDEIDSIGSSRLEGGSGGKENLLLIILRREIDVQWNLSNLCILGKQQIQISQPLSEHSMELNP
jgi:hypothetical protein